MRKFIFVGSITFLLSCFFPADSNAGRVKAGIDPKKNSIVIGCIKKRTIVEEDRFYYYGFGSPEIMLRNFELRDMSNNNLTRLSLDKDGCFATKTLSGVFMLQISRANQSDYNLRKANNIRKFFIPMGKLVNLGTYESRLTKLDETASGFSYSFKIVQKKDDEHHTSVLNWFRERYPEAAEKYKDRVVNDKVIKK